MLFRSWLQVPSSFTPVAPLECRIIPPCEVVVATLQGSYEGMPEVTAAVGTHIAANGLSVGPMFNIYRVSPAQNPDPSTWVTDVCFPHNRLMNLLSYRNAHSFPHPSRLRVFAESVTYNTPIDYAASGQPVAGMPPLHCTCRPPHRFTASKARQFNRRCRSVDRATRISTRNAPPLSTPIIKFR